jgi:hypothetical protein
MAVFGSIRRTLLHLIAASLPLPQIALLPGTRRFSCRVSSALERAFVLKSSRMFKNPAFLMEFAGIEGLLRFATTAAFLQRFALSSLEELTSTSFRLIPTKHPAHTCAKSGALYRPQS